MERTDSVVGEDVGIDGGAASAEEAAVHVIDVGADLGADPETDSDGGLPEP